MKSVTAGVVIALLLFLAGAASWKEARLSTRLADAHLRLATLRYDTEDDIDEALSVWNRLPFLATGSVAEDVRRHRATTAYWLERFDTLTTLTTAGGQASADPQLLLLAANASFRASAPYAGERKAAIERLDAVMQAYADVLRRDPARSDAAFNYEFVARMRDTLAKMPPSRPGAKDRQPPGKKPVNISVDLPAGGTVHGLPGGPPEGTDMSDFKTITPMRYDEREEQTLPGRGKELKRRG